MADTYLLKILTQIARGLRLLTQAPEIAPSGLLVLGFTTLANAVG
jgi:hypothetical protein